jgi:FlaA1/EpsC-like NDP-sugar epimerase
MKNELAGQDICVLGGTGSIGTALIDKLLQSGPKRIRCVSNDEYSMWQTEKRFGTGPMRYVLKDIRNPTAMREVLRGVDILFMLAAYKHIQYVEYSPQEAIDVNIIGNRNVIDEVLLNGRIQKVVNISTDKVCYAQSTYGLSKAIVEKLVDWASFYRPVGEQITKFASTRFGNVIGSRGSVLEHWFDPETTHIGLRDPAHRRFLMPTGRAIDLVLKCTKEMRGGETFIFKMPVVEMGVLAQAASDLTGKKIIQYPPVEGEVNDHWLMTFEESLHRAEDTDGFVLHRKYPTCPPMDYSTKSQKAISYDETREMLMEWMK